MLWYIDNVSSPTPRRGLVEKLGEEILSLPLALTSMLYGTKENMVEQITNITSKGP